MGETDHGWKRFAGDRAAVGVDLTGTWDLT